MRMRWWRLLAVPVVALLLLVGCAGAGGDGATRSTTVVVPAPPRSSAGAGGPLVGTVQRGDLAVELAPLDPRTLQPVPGGRLRLAGAWPMMAVAPGRSVAVLGSEVGDLTVIDLVHLRRLGDVRTGVPREVAFGWSWAGPTRLLLIGSPEPAATEVLAVDVGARRVIRRQRIEGAMQGYVRLPHGLALLVTPPDTIGPARLAVSDADAGLRTVALAEIDAGFEQLDDTDGSGPRMEQAIPGLAADPAGRRLYVVPDGGPVAEVDLAGLEVAYHRLRESESPLRRLARWWAPPAEAKTIAGSSRTALWLGDGQLAVTGYDGSPTGHHTEIPSGLELIDTESWTVRRVDRQSSGAVLAGGRLLAFGTAFGTNQDGANQGYGLTLYGPGDSRPTHRFAAKQVSMVQVNGDLAYIQVMDANASNVEGCAVMDLPSGRMLDMVTGNLPELLVPDRA